MKKYPIIYIALFILLGITLNTYFKMDTVLVVIVSFFAVYLFFMKNTNLNIIGIAIFLLVISIINFKICIDKIDYNKDNKVYTVTADVKDINKKNEKFTVFLTNVELDKKISEDMVLYLNDKSIDLKIGDKISFEDKIYVPRGNQNPGELNYFNYLLSKKTYYYSYSDNIKVDGLSEDVLLKSRRTFYDFVENSLIDFDKDIKHTIFSVITGNSIMEENQTDIYRNLGILHILSISGFHIVLLKIFIDLILSIFNINKKIKLTISIFLIFIYCLLIGFPNSAIRAFIFIVVDFIAFILKKPKMPIKTLSFACIIILMMLPMSIYDLGFQFSFLATLSIITIYPIIKNKNKKDSSIINIFYLTLSINLLICPLQLFYFGELPLGTFVGNIFVIPLLTIIITLGFLYLIVSNIYIFNFIVLNIIGFLFFIEDNILIGLNSIFSKLTIDNKINFSDLILLYIIIAISIFFIKNIILLKNNINILNNMFFKLVPSYLVFCILYLGITNPITFNMINIGQGDSFLLSTENHNILFDTGGKIFGESNSDRILNLLKYKKVKKLDSIFISHFDEDHSGNLKDILNYYKNAKVYGANEGKSILEEKYKIDSNYKELNKNDIFTYDNAKIKVIGMGNGLNNKNEDSVILKLFVENSSILLTGDIEKNKELSILNKDIKSDIIKVPHHGSKTSSNIKFIEKVNPKLALISVGLNNKYNHPSDEVVNLYKDMNIILKRTDFDGFVTINFNKNNFNIYDNSNYLRSFIDNPRVVLTFIYSILIICFIKIYLRNERKIY
ncbi:DNA internalization-related competence protein ComEC/Rec2 [Miniphocaeibacter massiliensis]|uniref:DNA internalization-related competence protein ComEC/Rec2 n=1 Tax=Miniphocaeibacter massiliensis TaxID=2041841 RepID=UPI000C06EA46|nr:DNA internalization-related competence protein ComEC/Rec2 [Miniphocaeibacter massiliensis]